MGVARPAAVFWGSAALAAAACAALAPYLIPFGALGLETTADRERAWLLTVFTAGVMALLFGGSGALGAFNFLSFRDVAEAGSVLKAKEEKRKARTAGTVPYTRNFALWLVATGVFLIAIYFALWQALR